MKFFYLKTLIFTFFLQTSLSISQTSGGPDTFGYTWKNSNDTNGPTFNWIDISTTGTEVIGLTDDNSIGMINMGINFNYYGISYNAIKIGSNGWVSFNNVSNIASCFPTIPSMGGAGDNLICPFMSDLIFTGTGNPGKVYYQIYQTNKFIITFQNVPFWISNAPNWQGSNTFQIILDTTNNSITLQYLNMDNSIATQNVGCSTDLVVGIENQTGNDGLLLLGYEVIPSNSFSIKIEDTNFLNTASFNTNSISLFPNPTKDYLTFNGLTEIEEYSIINIQGIKVLNGTTSNQEKIDIQKLQDGIYFIKFNNKEVFQFIKE